MTYRPERIYGPVHAVTPDQARTPYFCVDCLLEGVQTPLEQVFQVNGTVLCQNHAVAQRNAARS